MKEQDVGRHDLQFGLLLVGIGRFFPRGATPWAIRCIALEGPGLVLGVMSHRNGSVTSYRHLKS